MPANSQIAEYEPVRPARRAAQAAEPESLRPHGDVPLDAAERKWSMSFTPSGAPMRAPPPKPMIAMPVAMPRRSGNHRIKVETGEM